MTSLNETDLTLTEWASGACAKQIHQEHTHESSILIASGHGTPNTLFGKINPFSQHYRNAQSPHYIIFKLHCTACPYLKLFSVQGTVCAVAKSQEGLCRATPLRLTNAGLVICDNNFPQHTTSKTASSGSLWALTTWHHWSPPT
jgi:hypothetical protein